jgi:hypothetical protein
MKTRATSNVTAKPRQPSAIAPPGENVQGGQQKNSSLVCARKHPGLSQGFPVGTLRDLDPAASLKGHCSFPKSSNSSNRGRSVKIKNSAKLGRESRAYPVFAPENFRRHWAVTSQQS